MFLMAFGLLAAIGAGPVSAADSSVCKIPRGGDADGNGIGDAGVQVVCNYDSYYAEDASGAYYWDLGDGRVQTSSGITAPSDLDQSTLEECFYRVHTRGDFGNDPFLDSGEINNAVRCAGYEGTQAYYFQIVSQDDPRYTGNDELAIWGTWEYHVNVESGSGNLVHTLTNPSQ